VVKGNIALGEVGGDWTQYHPEWKPSKPRRKDLYYDRRTAEWRGLIVETPEGKAKIDSQLAELQKQKEEYQKTQANTYQLEVPYVVHNHKMRQVNCTLDDKGCQVGEDYVEWKEVKKFQQEMTR